MNIYCALKYNANKRVLVEPMYKLIQSQSTYNIFVDYS